MVEFSQINAPRGKVFLCNDSDQSCAIAQTVSIVCFATYRFLSNHRILLRKGTALIRMRRCTDFFKSSLLVHVQRRFLVARSGFY